MPNLVAGAVRQGLYTHIVGRRVAYYPALDSTMDAAARLAGEVGAGPDGNDGAVIIAERQWAGRGRQGRGWVSQPGNLLLSALFRPELAQLPFISIIGAVAAARAVRKIAGVSPALKWPNDLLLGGRKAAGILAESAIAGDVVDYAVLGIGVNVALDPAESGEIASIATSVNAAAGREVARELLLRQLLLELDDLYIRLRRGEAPLPEWRGLLATLGRRVTVVSGGETWAGLAEDVDATGNLLLRTDGGGLVTLSAGDVTIGGAN